MVGLFGEKTFSHANVLKKACQHVKVVRDQYRTHLERNHRYERPPMIPAMEWRALVEDGKERALRREGKLTPGTGRYAILSAM